MDRRQLIHTFSRQLLKLRALTGLDQEGFAERAGFTPQQICRFERGKSIPSLKNAVRLAKALGVSLDELLGFRHK